MLIVLISGLASNFHKSPFLRFLAHGRNSVSQKSLPIDYQGKGENKTVSKIHQGKKNWRKIDLFLWIWDLYTIWSLQWCVQKYFKDTTYFLLTHRFVGIGKKRGSSCVVVGCPISNLFFCFAYDRCFIFFPKYYPFIISSATKTFQLIYINIYLSHFLSLTITTLKTEKKTMLKLYKYVQAVDFISVPPLFSIFKRIHTWK